MDGRRPAPRPVPAPASSVDSSASSLYAAAAQLRRTDGHATAPGVSLAAAVQRDDQHLAAGGHQAREVMPGDVAGTRP